MLVLAGALAVIELGTAVLGSLGVFMAIWSSLVASLRIAMKLLPEPYPVNGQELLVTLHWTRLAFAVARAVLVTLMVGRLAKGTSDGVSGQPGQRLARTGGAWQRPLGDVEPQHRRCRAATSTRLARDVGARAVYLAGVG